MDRVFPIEETGQAFDWCATMREMQPVYQYGQGLWHVFRYDDVQRALSDYTGFSSQALAATAGDFLSDTLVAKDPRRVRFGDISLRNFTQFRR